MKRWIFIALLLPCFLGFTSLLMRENGLANMQSQDGTGSPYTNNYCGNCHYSGSFTPDISLTVRDTANNVVTQYAPGQDYELTFTITNGAGTPLGYGMQATVLDSENTFTGNFNLPGSYTQISLISGRQYVEQTELNPVNTFVTHWTAPNVLSGDLTFFFTGVATNGNNSPNGDNASLSSTFTLTPNCLPLSGEQNPVICTGSSYNYNGHTYSAPGTYLDTLQAVSGCDSVVTTNLAFTDTLIGHANATICFGDIFDFGGTPLTTAGVYYDTLTAAAGCDSVAMLNLTVNPIPQVQLFVPDTIVCIEIPIVNLSGAPAGGTFSGNGVSGNVFDASVATVGQHDVIYSFTDSNSCSNSDTSVFTVEICAGIGEDFNVTFSFGPNPAQNEINLFGLKPGMKVEITDLNGRTLQSLEASRSEEKISIENGAGIYFLRLRWENREWVKRFVVAH